MIGTEGLRAPDGRVLFTHAELACRASGGLRLAPGFGDMLVILRIAYGQPMRVTSCCRSAAHNKAVGGDARSFHVFDDPAHPTGGTCAIDIAAADAAIAHDLVAAAMRLGWSVGVPRAGVRFIHLDRRDLAGLPPAVFGY